MLTVVLAIACLWLLLALGVVFLSWRAAVLDVLRLEEIARNLSRRNRHLRDRIDGYRAELDALSIGPPSAATAALLPDDPSLLPAEVEQWLRERTN